MTAGTVERAGGGAIALVVRAADVVGAAALVVTAGGVLIGETVAELIDGESATLTGAARIARATGMNAGRAVSVGIAENR